MPFLDVLTIDRKGSTQDLFLIITLFQLLTKGMSERMKSFSPKTSSSFFRDSHSSLNFSVSVEPASPKNTKVFFHSEFRNFSLPLIVL